MSRKIFTGIAIGLVPMLALSFARAQQPAQAVGQQAAQGSHNKQQQIAEWLAADNFVTMEIAKLAKEQSKNDKVKKFAATVCEDHKKATARIQKVAPGAVVDLSKGEQGERAVARNQPSAAPGQRTSTLTADRSQGQLDTSKIKQQIARKRVECLKDELKELDGDTFDAAFLGQQVLSHQNMIATLTVLENEADGELKEIISKERKTAEEHMAKAKDLMKDIKEDRKDNDNDA